MNIEVKDRGPAHKDKTQTEDVLQDKGKTLATENQAQSLQGREAQGRGIQPHKAHLAKIAHTETLEIQTGHLMERLAVSLRGHMLDREAAKEPQAAPVGQITAMHKLPTGKTQTQEMMDVREARHGRGKPKGAKETIFRASKFKTICGQKIIL